MSVEVWAVNYPIIVRIIHQAAERFFCFRFQVSIFNNYNFDIDFVIDRFGFYRYLKWKSVPSTVVRTRIRCVYFRSYITTLIRPMSVLCLWIINVLSKILWTLLLLLRLRWSEKRLFLPISISGQNRKYNAVKTFY